MMGLRERECVINAGHVFVKRVVHSSESEDGGEERNSNKKPHIPEPQPRPVP